MLSRTSDEPCEQKTFLTRLLLLALFAGLDFSDEQLSSELLDTFSVLSSAVFSLSFFFSFLVGRSWRFFSGESIRYLFFLSIFYEFYIKSFDGCLEYYMTLLLYFIRGKWERHELMEWIFKNMWFSAQFQYIDCSEVQKGKLKRTSSRRLLGWSRFSRVFSRFFISIWGRGRSRRLFIDFRSCFLGGVVSWRRWSLKKLECD